MGFRYTYDPQIGQYMHPTGIVVLTPAGRVARYFYGVGYTTEDLRLGLVEASPSAYKEVSRFEIRKGDYPTWTPLVISDAKMYLRDQDNLTCFDIKANK